MPIWKKTKHNTAACSTKCSSEQPVINKRISDGLADEFTVLLQGVESVLDGLVNSFLDGATHLLNLVHTATWLRTGTQDKNMELYTKNRSREQRYKPKTCPIT